MNDFAIIIEAIIVAIQSQPSKCYAFHRRAYLPDGPHGSEALLLYEE